MRTSQLFMLMASSFVLVTQSVMALDLAYLKNNSLYFIPGVDRGNQNESRIESGVSRFVVNNGNLAYLKGNSLYLLANATQDPFAKALRIASGVGSFDIEGDLLVYLDGSRLFIRQISKAEGVQVKPGVVSFMLEDGHIAFLKYPTTLYRVTDINTGASEKIESSVGDYSIGN